MQPILRTRLWDPKYRPKCAYYRPVIPLLIAVIAGIAVGDLYPGHRMWALGSATAWFGLLAASLLRKKPSCLTPIFLFISIGYLSIQPWSAPHTPPNHVSRHTGPIRWEITGTVQTRPVSTGLRSRFLLAVETLKTPAEVVTATGNIRVTVAGDPAPLSLGDRIRFTSRLAAPRNLNNPGGFDYRRYLAFQGVRATAFSKQSGLLVLDNSPPDGFAHIIALTRTRISRLIETAVSSPGPQGVLKALLLGNRAGIPPGLKEAFNRAGVSHLLAISGLHVGIVAAGAFWLFTWVLSFFQPLLWQASARKWAAFLALFPVVAYGLVAGMSPSTQRAVIMVAIFLATFWLGRDQDPINTLAIAALAILSIHPPDLFSVSFQLSFSAVAVIILGMSRWPSAPADHPGLMQKMGRKAVTFVWVSTLAILGTLPLVMRYFNQVSQVGLLTNGIAVPIIGGCVVPLALFSLLIAPIWPTAAIWGLKAGAGLLDLCLPVINAVSELPIAATKTITPNILEIAAYYLLLGAVIHLVMPTRIQRNKGSTRDGRPVHQPALSRWAAGILIAVAAVALSADICYWAYARFWCKDLRATIIDVGQGSAALLEFPQGPVMLVDGGGFPDPNAFDLGARVVAPLLWRKKIRTVDTLVLSHPEADHMNGLLYIAENFGVKRLWATGDPSDSRIYHRLLEIAAQKKIEIPEFKTLVRIHQINGAQVEILHPPIDFISTQQKTGRGNRNDHSLVLRVKFGDQSILLPGDLMARGESRLVDTYGSALKSTILVSPHHGSRTSSTHGFLNMVNPEAVIVSAGYRNRNHHPHPTVLSRYRTRKTDIFCTASEGAVGLVFTGESLRLTPFLGDPAPRVYR